jgi:beta-phosphoglucomutase family hydrolase
VRAVIFDLDGVLVDSEPLLYEAERLMLAEHGIDLTPEMKRPFIGLGGREILEAFAETFGLDADIDVLADRKMSLYRTLLATVSGFAATADLARSLHDAGVPVAVASGSTPEAIEAALKAIGLRELFDVVVSVEEVSSGKPAPDVFLEAARRLRVAPAACVVVEDAIPGVRAARAAGMRCIAIPSVPDPLHEDFATVDLLVAGGMEGARAEEMLAWIRAVADEGRA